MSQEPAYIIDRPGLVEFPFGDTTPLESAKRSQFDNDPFAAWPTVDMMKSVKGLDTNGKMSAMFTPRFSPREGAPKRKLRVVHIGAGASGIYTVVRRNWSLPYVELQLYDKNTLIGGTWTENRYPGCANDIPSHLYSFSFELNPDWDGAYSGSHQIWEYMNNVADKYGVKDFVKFKHMVKGCKWIESAGKWEVTVEDLVTRKTFVDMADCIINGNGLLNTPKYTYIKDADKFKGKVLHTARWDPDYDLRGKRVAVIGTGATAVQLIPKIQPVVAHMTILQRTPTWVPNYPLGGRYSEADKQKFRSDPEFHKRYVDALFRMFESPALFLRNHKVQERMHRDTVARYEKDIKDPVLRAKLMPSFPLGCRRLTPSNSFLSAVQQPNVELNTDLIERCVEDGVILNVTGEHRKLDALIYATGYDNTLVPMFTVVGRNGNTLEKKWKDDIKSYLGIMTRDFPNYLMTLGPNGFPVGSALLAIEIQVDYIASLLQEMAFENLKAIEPKQSAEDSFDKEVWEYGEKTVMSQNCTTWMKAKNGKVVGTFPGGVNEQINRMNHIDMNDYEVVKMGESKL